MDDLSGYVSDDELAVEAFRRLGWEAEFVPWTAATNWTRFEAVLIRSTWDYHFHADHFLAVLAQIDAETLLLNPLEMVQWNASKTYLLDLRDHGVPIVPTTIGHALSREDLDEFMKRVGTAGIVVKPVIGGGADRTHLLRRGGSAGEIQAAVRDFSADEYMVQPFVESVVAQGEYSLFYFEGDFSHAVVKMPRPQDFRVQEEHGGIIRPIVPDAGLRAAARKAVNAAGPLPLYARVDLVAAQSGDWLLMELELIEPSLYLRSSPEAADRFADAFVKRIARFERARSTD